MTKADAPRVFISYSHDSPEHRTRVRELSGRLRADGIDARIDQYVEGTPALGWPIWMHDEIEQAHFVLVVCTETYNRRQLRREAPGVGLGATWEGGIVTQLLYEEQGRGQRFIPVIFERGDAKHIAVFLRDATRYELDQERGYIALRDCLLGNHATPMPPLGATLRVDVDAARAIAPRSRVASNVPAPVGSGTFADTEPVVIRFYDGGLEAFGGQRIDVADQVSLELIAVSEGGKEQLQRLRHVVGPGALRGAPQIAVAFGMVPNVTAVWLDVRDLSHRIEGGRTLWRLVGDPHRVESNFYDDMTFNGHTAAQIAEWRARRILLDERDPSGAGQAGIPAKSGWGTGRDSFPEALVSGAGAISGNKPSLGAVDLSPLPSLFNKWSASSTDRQGFLTVARLVACMWLVLTRTVQLVRRLDVQLSDGDTLTAQFEGVRSKVYSNRDADVIAFAGECKLHDR